MKLCTPLTIVWMSLGAAHATAAASAPQGEALAGGDVPTEARTVAGRSFGLTMREGRLQGDGPRYRAAFAPGRFEFTPALGRRAPHTLPVSFELQEIRVGDELLLDAPGNVVPRRDGSQAVYSHAGGIEERYEALPEGVHQTFLFPTRPVTYGDLVVRGRIRSTLPGKRAGQGVAFERPDLGGVTWGGVTGIDADGRAAAGDVRLQGNELELVLPADFVAEASYPLLLDPLISTAFVVNDDSFVVQDPAAAYDATEHTYLVVWLEWFSIWDIALRGQRLTSGGLPVGGVISITPPAPVGGALIASQPSVASVNSSNRFAVAWMESDVATPHTIKVAAIDADDGSVSPAFTVAGGTGNSQSQPVVGGERTLVDDDVLVLWREENVGLRMRQVTIPAAAGPYAPTAPVVLQPDFAQYVHWHPELSQSSGDSGRFLATWSRQDTLTEKSSVRAQLIDRNGQALGVDVNVSGFDYDYTNTVPKVDGDGERWVIAWAREELFTDKFDVMTRAVRRSGDSLVFDWQPNYLMSDFDDHESPWCVAWTGSSVMLAYWEETVVGSELFVTSVDPFTGKQCELAEQTSMAAGNVYGVDTASQWSGGSSPFTTDDSLVVFEHIAAAPSYARSIMAVRYDAPSDPMNLGGGMPGGGANVNPCAYSGNTDFRAQLVGSQPSSLVYFVVSPASQPIPCGGGTWFPQLGGPDIVVPRVTDTDGNASAQGSIPLNMNGIKAYTQWLTFLPGGGCKSNFVFSNALEITIQ